MQSLADAIIEENIPLIQDIIRSGEVLNQLDEYGFTPLVEAAIANNIEIAKLLLMQGADANLPDMTGGTALHWAAENNNVKLAKLLLHYHADPNAYNFSGQPVLTMPYLRQQTELKNTLVSAGAQLAFTQDYINTKLLGHMFELVGIANIISPNNQFVEVDFEGFVLEFSLSVIADSVLQFQNHFAVRKLRRYMNLINVIIETLSRAAKLIRYQQYQVDIDQHQTEIRPLIQQEPLIIPIGYEGHAITFIKLGNLLVKCDRREDSRLYDNVVIYQINRPEVMTNEFIQKLIFSKQDWETINNSLPQWLNLQPITEIKLAAQVSGNCSWANVEACLPTLFFLLSSQNEDFEANILRYKNLALDFFKQWREWNKDRSLQFCLQSFRDGDSIRKACKAEILAAILYQSCNSGSMLDRDRAESIISVIGTQKYEYILQNYIKTYCYEDSSEEGKNFLQLLKSLGYRT